MKSESALSGAEKYLKSLLVWHSMSFPKTHSIGKLLDLLASRDKSFADKLEPAAILTIYGVQSRYPGSDPDISREAALRAHSLAALVRENVRAELKQPLQFE